jgi:hypothetical protein
MWAYTADEIEFLTQGTGPIRKVKTKEMIDMENFADNIIAEYRKHANTMLSFVWNKELKALLEKGVDLQIETGKLVLEGAKNLAKTANIPSK